MSSAIRLKAALHEMRCWECRVTWRSWAQRIIGMKRGFTPKLSKPQRALVDRAAKADAEVEKMRWRLDQAVQGRDRAQLRVRELQDAQQRVIDLADDYEAQVVEVESANDGPNPWTDTITNVVARIREAVAGPTPPKGWIHVASSPSASPEALGEAESRPFVFCPCQSDPWSDQGERQWYVCTLEEGHDGDHKLCVSTDG
jgi:hypothetical protein